MAPRQFRTRPVLTVTIDADRLRRLRRLTSRIPGAKASAVVDEMLKLTLPIWEEVADAFEAARRADGTADEAMAQKHVEAYLGAMLLKFMAGQHDPENPFAKGGEDST
jgi:hypothetical protein